MRTRFELQRDRAFVLKAIEEHHELAYRVALRVVGNPADAEDVAQETFVRLLERTAAAREAGNLRAWIARIALNGALTVLRKRESRARHETAWAEARAETRSTPEANGIEAVRAAVAALPVELRVPVVLHYEEGLTYREVAAVLECPRGTIAGRLAAARERLRERLAGRLSGLVIPPFSPRELPGAERGLAHRLRRGVETRLARAGFRSPCVATAGYAIVAALVLAAAVTTGVITTFETAGGERTSRDAAVRSASDPAMARAHSKGARTGLAARGAPDAAGFAADPTPRTLAGSAPAGGERAFPRFGVYGFVLDATGKPIAGAEVRCSAASRTTPLVTDEDGFFEFLPGDLEPDAAAELAYLDEYDSELRNRYEASFRRATLHGSIANHFSEQIQLARLDYDRQLSLTHLNNLTISLEAFRSAQAGDPAAAADDFLSGDLAAAKELEGPPPEAGEESPGAGDSTVGVWSTGDGKSMELQFLSDALVIAANDASYSNQLVVAANDAIDTMHDASESLGSLTGEGTAAGEDESDVTLPVVLEVVASGFESQRAEVELPHAESVRVDFELLAVPVLAGRVVGEGGAPLESATVTVAARRAGGSVPSDLFESKTGADGTFTFGSLSPGAYVLAFDAEGYWPAEAVVWTGEELVVELERSASLRVDAGDARGPLTAGAATLLREGRAAASAEFAEGDGAGTVVFSRLRPGRYELRVTRGSSAPHDTRRLHLLPGEDAVVDVTLSEPLTVSGAVRLAASGDAPRLPGGFLLRLQRFDHVVAGFSDSGADEVTFDAAESYRLEGLPPGLYSRQLFAAGAQRLLHADEISLREGEGLATRDIELEPGGGCRLTVSVATVDGEPVPGASVKLYRGARQLGASEITPGAPTWVLGGVLTLVASADGYLSEREIVTVRAGEEREVLFEPRRRPERPALVVPEGISVEIRAATSLGVFLDLVATLLPGGIEIAPRAALSRALEEARTDTGTIDVRAFLGGLEEHGLSAWSAGDRVVVGVRE